jgi:hypothetical protein
MATNAGSAAAPGPSGQDLNDAYSQLLNHLNEAYWAAGTTSDREQIKVVMDDVTDVITGLNATDLETRDDAYIALSAHVKTANKQLETLQHDIKGIVSGINTAAAIVSDISTVVSLAAQVFPHI